MFSNDKLRFYLFIFLAFAVLSSKNILIYNEETLVALSFFCFVFFVLHYFGNTIKESLNERSQVIREELQNFVILKEKSFQDLLNQHQKVSRLMNAMSVLNTFTKNELNSLNQNSEKALNNLFSSRIQNKLKTLVLSKLMMQQTLQTLLSEIIISNVLVAFPKAGKQAIQASKNKAINKALNSFIANKQNRR
uniref:ATP synthase protein MI25 n=1 Tax=Micractinium conductrix TaxID=554055 RepID=A0A2I4S790_9CHLO|nr:ATP synthase F0 subunit beta [Micractinium conductrix]